MNLGAVVGGVAKGQFRRRGRAAALVTAAGRGFRIFRRITSASGRPAIRFAVKPGEVYEIRGIRREK
jgi:hypothetical protein